MNEAPVWKCDWVGAGSLTVGQRYQLNCKGDIPLEWPKEGYWHVTTPRADQKYALQILRPLEVNSQSVRLEVTSYNTGQLEMDYLRIFKGDVGFEITKPNWKVATVIQQTQEPTKPFESIGPYALGFPMWILFSMGAALAVLLVIVIRSVRKWNQRRRLREELRLHRTALSPLHQYYRDARNLKRKLDNAKSQDDLRGFVDGLNKEFKLYFVRKFEIPALDWSDRQTVREVRKCRKGRRIDSEIESLKTSLRELHKLKSRQDLKAKDLDQLYRICMISLEQVEGAFPEVRL